MRTTTLIAVAGASLVTLGLAGCSADHPAKPAPSDSASASGRPPAAGAAWGVSDPSGRCADGAATPAGNGKEFDLGGCAFVNVLGNKNTITLGDTDKMTIEGSNNTITVSAVKEITSTGKNNTVYYAGDEPAFDELGSGTKVAPQKR